MVHYARAVAKFWAGLHLRRGDIILALLCLFFQGQIMRALYAAYMLVLGRVDPDSRRVFRPATYEESMFAAIARAGTLRLGGGISVTTMAMRILFAIGASMGISDPIRGGTPLRFRRIATALFFGWTVSQMKRRLLMRGDVGGFRTPRQRFVLDRLSDAAIIALVLLACIESAGVPIQSVATFGGLGGLALGLAGKEVMENVFGGVWVLTTSPFTPGEAVKADRGISGVIQNVGFYSTKMIDFDGCTRHVPNSLFTTAIVTNLTRATRRRFKANYALRYADLGRVERITERVRDELRSASLVDDTGYIRSHVVAFGKYAVECEASCLFLTNSRDLFLSAQQEGLLLIARVVHEEGARFAVEFEFAAENGEDDSGARE